MNYPLVIAASTTKAGAAGDSSMMALSGKRRRQRPRIERERAKNQGPASTLILSGRNGV